MYEVLFLAVIQRNLEASGQTDKELMQLLVGMSAAVRSRGNIIKIKNPLNIKRQVPLRFYEGEIAARVSNFRKLDEFVSVEYRQIEPPLP